MLKGLIILSKKEILSGKVFKAVGGFTLGLRWKVDSQNLSLLGSFQ